MFLLCFVFIAAACATTNGRRGLPPPGTAANASVPPHCPDRIDRAKAGGAVGNVVGFVAASALGSPLMGILYSVGGYTAGFASADRCKKETATLAAASPQTANGSRPAQAGKVIEEDLK